MKKRTELGRRVFSLGGLSGVGKDTVAKEIISRFPEKAIRFPRTTTRPPRVNEQHGISSFFVAEKEFKHQEAEGRLVGIESHKNALYGIDLAALLKLMENNNHESRILIVGGLCGIALKKELPTVTNVFLTASIPEVIERMRRRGDSEADIVSRLDWLIVQDKQRNDFDVVVENTPGRLDQTIERIISLMGLDGTIT